jgi:hypothetical protein
MERLTRVSLLALALSALLMSCGTPQRSENQPASTSSTSNPAAPAAAEDKNAVVLVGAGDIASCDDLTGAEATAKLLDNIPGTVFAAGDLAYSDGSSAQFQDCYGKTWGRFKDRTRPAPGNHEYHTANASGYFTYFGKSVGDPNSGWYSYELGAWHIIAINSDCSDIGGCNAGSREERWLRDDLKAHPTHCTLAYWHHPLFSSGKAHGNDPEMKPLWQALYDAEADVVVNGHDHDYERFAPQDPNGDRDLVRGIREFVVGTGGKNLRPFRTPLPNSEIRSSEAFGVLKLTLRPKTYDWEFVPVAGETFRDSGSGVCH